MTARTTFSRSAAQVRDLMTSEVVTAEPTATVKDLAALLVERDVRMVPVVDIDGQVAGVVSEADLISREGYPTGRRRRLRDQISFARDEHRHHWSDRAEGVTAGEVMTREVVTCRPDEPIAMVTRRMLHEDVRSLPVIEDGRLVGVLSRHDILCLFDRPDGDILEAVRSLLASPTWAPEGSRITVRVRDGVVVLEGSTRFEGDVPVVEALVSDVPGVVGVTNLVTGREKDPRIPVFGRAGS